ncbi:MAG: tRNA uridine-5-carboxymethylaminomethyl(34) synthesis GTPase MnmE [Mycoplasmatales bacterium]
MSEIIAAIATPSGPGGISIIRISGKNTIKIVNKYIKGQKCEKLFHNSITYSHFTDNNNIIIDEILLSVFHAPNSFTGEETVEINCHGGIYNTNLILKTLLLDENIRMAEPGEFSKTAFLNGKKSLTEAEGLMDIIQANNEKSHKMAVKAITGETKSLIEDMRQDLIEIVSLIEVNIDYPEYSDIEIMTLQTLESNLSNLDLKIKEILVDSKKGEIIKYGINTAIVGLPNVGKSSLLNLLSREEKAIVTDIAGTTRDTIEVKVDLGGIILNLIDSAGIRKTDDIVEEIGVKKSMDLIQTADLILFVLDSQNELTEYEKKLLAFVNNKNIIHIINKSDINPTKTFHLKNEILMSAKRKTGVKELENKILDLYNIADFDALNSNYVTNIRHIAALEKVSEIIKSIKQSISLEIPIDVIEIDLKEALFILGEILGIEVKDDLLNELFGRFCLGK